MAYKMGNMGTTEVVGLVFILTIPRIFLSTPEYHIIEVETAAWLSNLISNIVSLGAGLLLVFVLSKLKGDIITAAQTLLGRTAAGIITAYLIIFFILNCSLLIRQFAENTLLTALPFAEFSWIQILYVGVIGCIAFLGVEAIARSSYIILPFGVLGLLIVLSMLFPFFEFHCLAPWLGTGLMPVLAAGIKFSGVNAGLLAIGLLSPTLQTPTVIRYGLIYGIITGLFLKVVSIIAFIMTFDVRIAQEKILPFFEMTRLVYISIYLQHIEALFIILWVMTGVFSIAASMYFACYLIARGAAMPSIRPFIPLVAVLVINLASLPPDVASVVNIDKRFLMWYGNAGLFGIPILLLLAHLLHSRKRRAGSCVSGS